MKVVREWLALRKRAKNAALLAKAFAAELAVGDGWAIEIQDFTGRWGAINDYELRSDISEQDILIHHWSERSPLTFDAACHVLKAMLDYDMMNHRAYWKGRALRLHNIKTDDFFPLEALNINVEPKDRKAPEDMSAPGAAMANLKKAQTQAMQQINAKPISNNGYQHTP